MEKEPNHKWITEADSDEDLWIEDSSTIDADIFLLANPYSGSNEAVAYTELDKKTFTYTLDDGTTTQLRIINVTAKEEMQTLKDEVAKCVHHRFVVNRK